MRLIDADALERDGWRMSRIVQIDEKTMEAQTRKPTDFPTIEPERIRGKWQWLASTYDRTPCEMRFRCSVCHHETITHGSAPWEKFCPNCGADMRETDGSED